MSNSQEQPDPLVLNAIDNYYRLKHQYENNKHKFIKKIMSNPEHSLKEKRRKAQQLKLNCIGCKRKVDTIFTTNNRILKATCGDKLNKCGLNIEIAIGETINIRIIIQSLSAELNTLNQDMIKNKLDLLFGYINEEEAIAKFETLQVSITENKTGIETSQSVENDFTKIDIEEANTLKIEIFKYINDIKNIITEYNANEQHQLIIDIIEMYQNQLIPKINELNEITYKCMNVIIEDTTPVIYKLNLLPYTLANPEYIMSQSKIISNTKK